MSLSNEEISFANRSKRKSRAVDRFPSQEDQNSHFVNLSSRRDEDTDADIFSRRKSGTVLPGQSNNEPTVVSLDSDEESEEFGSKRPKLSGSQEPVDLNYEVDPSWGNFASEQVYLSDRDGEDQVCIFPLI